MGAAAALKAKYPALQVLASPEEAPYIEGRKKNLRLQQAEALQDLLPEERKTWGERFCRRLRLLQGVPVDGLIREGDIFDWGGGCRVLATPGHTPGHLSLVSSPRSSALPATRRCWRATDCPWPTPAFAWTSGRRNGPSGGSRIFHAPGTFVITGVFWRCRHSPLTFPPGRDRL